MSLPGSPLADDLQVLDQGLAWRAAGRPVALATVVAAWGSAPRPLGSQMAVGEQGSFVGSVSGGCVEGAVVEAAMAAIADHQPRLLDFTVDDGTAWSHGLACGGALRVYVAPLDSDALAAARHHSRPVALVTRLLDGAAWTITAESVDGPLPLASDLLTEIHARLADGTSGPLADPGLFCRIYATPWRLEIVGAVHIAQHLAVMAAACGWAVRVIDPRAGFLTAERFPGLDLVQAWPDEVLAPDPRTAVAALSHDPKIDDPALLAALRSPARYIGALGSRRTHAKRLERLRQAGCDDESLARLRAPIGLDLGGRAPPEIAVAVLAELIAVRYGRG